MIKIIDKIILIGSSHVAKNSIKEINDTIDKFKPAVVGIELDTLRFKNLMREDSDKNNKKTKSNYKMISELGLFGYLFAQIAGFVQKKVGKSINIDPGIDMKSAYLKARELKIPVSLIDINIKTTMKKLSKLPFFKKMSLFGNLFFKSFKKEYRNLLNFDLNSVPNDETVLKMINILKKETPALYQILIHDRNIYMSDKLLKLKEKHEGYILAVVGAGHVDGMTKYIQEKLQQNKHTNNISFSYNVDVDYTL